MSSDDMFSNYPDILNTKQLQDMLGLSKNSVLDLLKSGEIKYLRKGKKYLIPKICVKEYIMSKIA